MIISIITINRNNKQGLEQTIHSVLKQSAYPSIQYIVIDGASTDGSQEVIASYEDRLYYSVSEHDTGIYNAMNKGVAVSTGDYLLFLNSGDILSSETVIEQVVDVIEGRQLPVDTFYMGYVNCMTKEGKVSYKARYNDSLKSAWEFLCSGIPHQSAFIPRCVQSELSYDESYRICADFKFFMESLLIRHHNVALLDVVVSDYDTSGISSVNLEASMAERYRAFLEVLPWYVVEDYKKVLPYKNSRFRIKWIVSHPFVCKVIKLITSVGMRLSR